VSKPEIGKMRMHFWKDTIDKIYAVSSKKKKKKEGVINLNFLFREIHQNNQLLWLYQRL
jgi:hypothetical protein